MGPDCHILGVLKEIRAKTSKNFGDTIEVIVEPDLEPRVVEIPPDLAKALKQEKTAAAYFNSLAYSHQKEYVGYILEAKREETRAKRIAKTIEVLKQGK